MTSRTARPDAGFSLPEMMISMGIMLVILAGTFTAMTSAMRAEQTATAITTVNNNLRSAMDLLVRDLLQVGQGMPVGRVLNIPSGAGSRPIRRPGPAAAGGCPGTPLTFAAAATISAVTVGPSLGPPINNVCTDVITTLAFDGAFDGVFVSSIAADGQSLTVYPYGPDKVVGNGDDVNISDDPDAAGDNIRVGDLLAVVKGSSSALVAVTAVTGNTITFDPGDALDFNQFDVTRVMAGTVNRVKAASPADPNVPTVTAGVVTILAGQSTVSRVRMVSYWIDSTTNPASPRLMRQVGSGTANAVSFELEAFVLTYDIANGTNNRANVRMVAADVNTTGGACTPLVCSPNQIRKVNATLAIRSDKKSPSSGYYHNTLFTQVALRNLAFVDRYE
jgi:prepilin-type N-terminal cleavage/methylation domain-containing protein